MDFWYWFFGAIGAIAFIMAIQPFIQMILGKPRIETSFGKIDNCLECEIYNIPVSHPLLLKMGIIRNPVNDLSVTYYITKKNHISEESTTMIESPELDYFGKISKHISLPASLYEGAKFSIGTKVKVCKSYFSKPKVRQLTNGQYTLHLAITYDGKNKEYTQNFMVLTDNKTRYIDWELEFNEL